jgi:GNAT superfamily N-acetyltransferase
MVGPVITAAVSIRIARTSDADDVARLTTELGYTVEPPVLRERLSRILARADQRFLVAEAEGRTVAWLHAAIAEFVETGRFVLIAGLVVAESHRRRGIGRLLMERAEEWATEQGCPVVRLWSSSSRTRAHQFYERVGYTIIKTQYSFGKPLDPAEQTFVPRVKSDT